MTPTGAPAKRGAGAEAGCQAVAADPTIWGLTPLQLHDRFWASLGVAVVRPADQDCPLPSAASAYLLLEPGALVLFDLPDLNDPQAADLLYLRFRDPRETGLRERIITDSANRFVRFERLYGRRRGHIARVALTRDARLAQAWITQGKWRSVRKLVSQASRDCSETVGMLFDGVDSWEQAAFTKELVRVWGDPSPVVGRAIRAGPAGWRDRDTALDSPARLVGQVWIGCGRQLDAASMVVGPAILWDDPQQRPVPEPIAWEKASPRAWLLSQSIAATGYHQPRQSYLAIKRLFDIAFAVLGLVFTLPLYPVIMLAIVLEDGRPFFFAHRRETVGGREFSCIKFRSMRRNAEAVKHQLLAQNQADGPQFYLAHDPRLTRVGKVLRRFRMDELPQFINVLRGEMSIVGPRPSPYRENQFCPAWRRLRLSVRPGITGLWQVARTRAEGTDFQEWIRYDIEYVENASWALDFKILWRTLRAVLKHPAR